MENQVHTPIDDIIVQPQSQVPHHGFLEPIPQESLTQIFLEARTFHGFLNEDVNDDVLRKVYDLMKWGPTSANCSPARIIFVRTKEAKEKLAACLDKGNIKQTLSAPVTAIVAYDMKFYDRLPTLFPHGDSRSWYAGKPEFIQETAFRNGSIQGAYLIIAARALGLDCGPMSGFDNKKVDKAFFEDTSWKSNFLVNLGYGDKETVYPRDTRLDFKEACWIV
jgi:3-hydroxypropanoate dehydrogenase